MFEHKTTIIVVEKGGRFLLVKRKNRPNKGYWCLPGGHVDRGESVYRCALREAEEEVGKVKMQKRPMMNFKHYIRIGHRHHAFVFRGTPIKIKAGSDAARAKFFTIKQMANMNLTHYTLITLNRLFPSLTFGDWHRRH